MYFVDATQRLVKTKNNGTHFEAGTIESIKEKLEGTILVHQS